MFSFTTGCHVQYVVGRVRLLKLKDGKDAKNVRVMGKNREAIFPAQAVTVWEQYKVMPAIHTKTIRTMRNVWDEKRGVAKRQGGSAVFSKPKRVFGRQAEEGLAKTKKYFMEHLKLKKVAMDFLPDYEKYLGNAGFTKI